MGGRVDNDNEMVFPESDGLQETKSTEVALV